MTKDMICVDCLMRIAATIAQARRHGWSFWVGGARCKSCLDERVRRNHEARDIEHVEVEP